jgi:NAD(P)-dependent dehydrogenase (short-subunit alcohol dehydrogenase family)
LSAAAKQEDMDMSQSDSPVAIVTGAGRGIGREHALALARAGWAVVVNDLGGAADGAGADAGPAAQVVAEIEAMGGRAVADGSDVSNWQAAGQLIEKAVGAFGRLDGLVNNAGCLRDRTLANMTEEDWDVVLAVNLKGTAAPLHHAAKYWRDLSKSTGGPVRGSVVNTTSGSGLYSNPGQTNYAAAKAGVASMTIVAARELARYGVRVNAVAPVAATRLTGPLMGEDAKDRLNPAFVSPLIVYLLGPDSEEVTGRVFDMGGGGFVAVDPPRPVIGFRVEDGMWTPEGIAKAAKSMLGEIPAPMSSGEAFRFMHGLPVVAKERA